MGAPRAGVRMDTDGTASYAAALKVDILEKVPPARLLVLLAGSAALVLGFVTFLLQWSLGPRVGPLGLYGGGPLVLMLLIDLAFGAFLLYAYTAMSVREREWAVVVLAFALVLLVLGGVAGAVAGILAGVGAVSVIVHEWRAPRVV